MTLKSKQCSGKNADGRRCARRSNVGYKGFLLLDGKLVCRGFEFEIGGEYKLDEPIMLCKTGFHYCNILQDVFKYYYGNDMIYCEVEALGDVDSADDKCCTNHIRVLKPLNGVIGKCWFMEGQLHRADGPAVEHVRGDKEWWLNGRRHRADGPAVEFADGGKSWWLNGQFHRVDGPAVEYANGDKYWYMNGQPHRTDGPAIECANGDKSWWFNGKLHRTDGPAVESANGDKSWWLNGINSHMNHAL